MRELADTEQRAVEQLRTAFRSVKHRLWSEAQINADPTRFEKLDTLRKKGEAAWSPEEIDWLYFKAETTVGDSETVKYVFVRFIEILLRGELLGSTSEGIIVSKLDYAHFEAWPEPQRMAALTALAALEAYWTTSGHWYHETLENVRAFIARHKFG